MSIPNGGLIVETNEQYYSGAQRFFYDPAVGVVTTFNTDLILGSWNENVAEYNLNNFKLYTSSTGLPGSYNEWQSAFTVTNGNTLVFSGGEPTTGHYVVVQLKALDGGKYDEDDAYGDTVQENLGGYAYTSLDDVINGFMAIYVGEQKLIADVKRTDVIFHAKRGLQEFSYDTLKSIKSQEITIPSSLSVAFPQDYVNYTMISYIDAQGAKHPMKPANNLHTSPGSVPLQDGKGQITTDNFGDQLEGTSITNERWATANMNLLNGNISKSEFAAYEDYLTATPGSGQRYGGSPEMMQNNGWFNMNERDGVISFSSDMSGRLILLEYISDGLAYSNDMRIPKMAEDALYAHIIHAIISTRINQPEYIVQRLKKERYAKMRNAKIRLSNIKLSEIVQVMRGKSKWIK